MQTTPQTITITGASGLIGSNLSQSLINAGHTVRHLVRRPPTTDQESQWNPTTNQLDPNTLANTHTVIHLAGESILGRWTTEKKHAILTSRTQPTALLAKTLANIPPAKRPHTLIAASAVGYYGHRPNETLTESDAPGKTFLAAVCKQWESATLPAKDANIRIINLRIPTVLTTKGGALATMLTPFKLGLGGKFGSGRQAFSWITLPDLIAIVHHLIANPNLKDPINATAPNPTTNAHFTKTLGRTLHRPTLATIPTFALRTLLGDMGRELLLTSTAAIPEKLTQSGFIFQHPTIEKALPHLLNTPTH